MESLEEAVLKRKEEIRLEILAEKCEDIAVNLGTNQYDELGLDYGNGWVDLIYNFKGGSLEVEGHFLCDGPRSVLVSYNKLKVFEFHFEDDYENAKIMNYEFGEWEEEIEKIHGEIKSFDGMK